jgi:putative DNA primase/helicase
MNTPAFSPCDGSWARVLRQAKTGPIADAIKSLLADATSGHLPGHWEGMASELLAALDKQVTGQQFSLKTFPKNARSLSNRLRRDAPALRAVGVQVAFRKSGATRYLAFSPVAKP